MSNRKSKTFNGKNAYPLEWPTHISRTNSPESGRFRTSLHNAMKNVESELERLADDSGKEISNIIISSNYTLGDMNPDDAGVCVYFTWNGSDLCFPVDKYDTVEDNLQAIYHIINADRTKIRHGGLEFVMAEKRGETNLLTDGSENNWWEVLGVDKDAPFNKVKKQYRKLAKEHHPDRVGLGNHATTMAEINRAWDEAKKSLKKN